MTKNDKGGKKHRRTKNIVVDDKVDLPEDGQYFAKIIKLLGSGRVNLDYYYKRSYSDTTNDKDATEWTRVNCMGIIRGSMMKKIYINIGDIVLITPRDFEAKKVDIICKYSQYQLDYIKKHMTMPNIDNEVDKDIEFDITIDDEIINDI
jgi:translation initiation factor IF-1